MSLPDTSGGTESLRERIARSGSGGEALVGGNCQRCLSREAPRLLVSGQLLANATGSFCKALGQPGNYRADGKALGQHEYRVGLFSLRGRLRWRPSTERLLKTCSSRRQKSKLPARGKAAVAGELVAPALIAGLRIVGISPSSCHRHCTFAAAIVLCETPVSCYREMANGIRHTA